MSTPPKIRRIRTEDFDEELRPAMGKIAASLNDFMDEVIFILNRRVDFQNLNEQIVDITVSTDASKNLINPPTIRTTVNGKVIGVIVISVIEVDDPNGLPEAHPYVQWTINTGIVKVLNASGLKANKSYNLRLRLTGENT